MELNVYYVQNALELLFIDFFGEVALWRVCCVAPSDFLSVVSHLDAVAIFIVISAGVQTLVLFGVARGVGRSVVAVVKGNEQQKSRGQLFIVLAENIPDAS